ncbi:hypothetical protein L1887_13883 [Cichorium endivia]|nr:hypothetical protein L1887_13883 [Cichorium endivia]
MQSMGGLITMLMYFQSDPDMWSDLILASPHLIISDVMISSKVPDKNQYLIPSSFAGESTVFYYKMKGV